MDYANDDDSGPIGVLNKSCEYSVKCANESYYTCPEHKDDKPDFLQCTMPLKECNCKGCQNCLDVSCLKKKFACKKSGKGKAEKLCSKIGEYSAC